MTALRKHSIATRLPGKASRVSKQLRDELRRAETDRLCLAAVSQALFSPKQIQREE
ncbi:MAG: hypothetical protein JWM16_6321 [Verrucomicrobiales bacterium]|nr:hypothetical protein [Verrucomicrobiales bacterium]